MDILLCRIGMGEDEEEKENEQNTKKSEQGDEELQIDDLSDGSGKGIID